MQVPKSWSYVIFMGVCATIAVQSIVLKTFRQSRYSSERFVPRWYHRAAFVAASVVGFIWALVKFISIKS